MVLVWIFLILAIYLILVFLLPLLILPNYLLFQTDIKITNKIKKIATKLKSRNKHQTLKKVFNYTSKTYSSQRPYLFILLNKHFYHNVDSLVDKKQFLPCHVQSLVFRTLLLATKQFSENDLKKKIVMTPFGVIHQFYYVNVKNKIYKVDSFFNDMQEVSK